MKIDNEIKIPWYRRNIKIGVDLENGIQPLSIDFPDIPKSTPRQPVRQPVRQPIRQPATQPTKAPFPEPFPNLFPNPFPNGEWQPNNPFPFPLPLPKDDKTRLPNPNPSPQPIPQPVMAEKKNPFEKTFGNLLKPIIYFFAAREIATQYVKVTVKDPVYKEMLKDPVLGTVLREGEKANLDAAQLGTILANFDWEKGDYKELEKSLAVGIGAAGAARLMVFIIGRKIIFRI